MEHVDSMVLPQNMGVDAADTIRGPQKGFTVEVHTQERTPLTEEEKLDRARTLLQHNPSYTRVFLNVLGACDGTAHTLGSLEETIAAMPSYEKLKNPPFFPVHWLHQAFALEEMYLDAQGNLLSAADVAGLDEDAFDDLVAQYAYRTTETGRAVALEFSPARRIQRLLLDEPVRRDTYIELMGFMRQKRSFSEVEALLRGREILSFSAEDGVTVQPSMFVDKLESVGAIAFDGGWETTKEGKELLESKGEN